MHHTSHGDWLANRDRTQALGYARQISGNLRTAGYGVDLTRRGHGAIVPYLSPSPGTPVCIQLTSGAAWHSSSVDGSLTYDATISAAIKATKPPLRS